ncbi:hypothetical protein PSTEL_23105 [Paenibacillus stellifer]|uniref:Uncharacterized protein n=1 Tax=Paenibacillus stellifer TaxID=169760 RepID=A0A089LVK3_9BACL|nr:hypothetical protein PSTEL_23105 [Paenibacillus stellifer]
MTAGCVGAWLSACLFDHRFYGICCASAWLSARLFGSFGTVIGSFGPVIGSKLAIFFGHTGYRTVHISAWFDLQTSAARRLEIRSCL